MTKYKLLKVYTVGESHDSTKKTLEETPSGVVIDGRTLVPWHRITHCIVEALPALPAPRNSPKPPRNHRKAALPAAALPGAESDGK